MNSDVIVGRESGYENPVVVQGIELPVNSCVILLML